MQINHADYFTSLGFKEEYYDGSKNKFNSEKIITRITAIQNTWQKKYPKMVFKTENLKFNDMLNFNFSYTTALEELIFDTN
jgi:hypothetical protein